MFVAAGVFQILEESYYTSIGSALQFHQAVYFVFVTMSTVGFGDITPKNTACTPLLPLSFSFSYSLRGEKLTLLPPSVSSHPILPPIQRNSS